MSSIFEQFGLEGIEEMFISFGFYGLLGIGLLIAGGIAFYSYNYKKTYPYKIRVRSLRSNGNFKERNFKGGIIKSRSGTEFFRIRLGWKMGDYIDLFKVPDFNYVDSDDRIWYERIGQSTFIQLRIRNHERLVLEDKETGEIIENPEAISQMINSKEIMEKYNIHYVHDILFEPIDAEKKSMTVARLSLDVLEPLKEKESLLKAWLPIIAISLIGVFALAIVYVLLTNPTPCVPVPCVP